MTVDEAIKQLLKKTNKYISTNKHVLPFRNPWIRHDFPTKVLVLFSLKDIVGYLFIYSRVFAGLNIEYIFQRNSQLITACIIENNTKIIRNIFASLNVRFCISYKINSNKLVWPFILWSEVKIKRPFWILIRFLLILLIIHWKN